MNAAFSARDIGALLASAKRLLSMLANLLTSALKTKRIRARKMNIEINVIGIIKAQYSAKLTVYSPLVEVLVKPKDNAATALIGNAVYPQNAETDIANTSKPGNLSPFLYPASSQIE